MTSFAKQNTLQRQHKWCRCSCFQRHTSLKNKSLNHIYQTTPNRLAFCCFKLGLMFYLWSSPINSGFRRITNSITSHHIHPNAFSRVDGNNFRAENITNTRINKPYLLRLSNHQKVAKHTDIQICELSENGSHFNSYVAAKNRIDEVFWITNLTLILHDLEKNFNLKVSWIILSKWNYQVYYTLACYKNPISSFSNEVIPKLEVSRYLCYASVRLISATERCAQIKRMNLVSNTFILQFFLYHFKLFVLMHSWKNRSNQVTKDDH